MTSPPHLPTVYLQRMAAQHPGCWRAVDELRARRGRGVPWWPPWCFLPLAAGKAVLAQEVTADLIPELAAFVALASWRTTQGIYDFHPEIRAAVEATPLDGALPADALRLLPEWCVYVRRATPQGLGFFAFIDHNVGTGDEDLRLLIDSPPLLQAVLPIRLGAGSLATGIATAVDGIARLRIPGMKLPSHARIFAEAGEIAPIVSLLLYLCAKNAELRDAAGKRERPEAPKPRPTKDGPRIFPPDRPTVWEAGWRTGPAIEAARTQERGEAAGSTHASPRPHIRRAHWAHYWTGPRASPESVLRWIAPVAVGVSEERPIVPTVRPVE